MNPLMFAYISKKVTESLSTQSDAISSAVYANVPKKASVDELIPIVVGNVLQIAVSISICMTLELLDYTGNLCLSEDETALRKELLSLLKK